MEWLWEIDLELRLDWSSGQLWVLQFLVCFSGSSGRFVSWASSGRFVCWWPCWCLSTRLDSWYSRGNRSGVVRRGTSR